MVDKKIKLNKLKIIININNILLKTFLKKVFEPELIHYGINAIRINIRINF